MCHVLVFTVGNRATVEKPLHYHGEILVQEKSTSGGSGKGAKGARAGNSPGEGVRTTVSFRACASFSIIFSAL